MTDEDFDGCRRECRKAGAHTLRPGECEHGPVPEPTVSISRVETMADGHRGIVLTSVPAWAFRDLIKVAMHVSTGKSFAFVGQGPYPDALARRALGALDDAGLLPDPGPAGDDTPEAAP
ncbi:hypothetical protein [Streptomyces synnematoformans]|uniref:Uncharacterized protein n=1 Tax=Streptomyces synnematoformans TaxID=415721 RepID=A0ABP5IWR0_9ACTN